jgi:hypothetical protein
MVRESNEYAVSLTALMLMSPPKLYLPADSTSPPIFPPITVRSGLEGVVVMVIVVRYFTAVGWVTS